MPKLYELTDPRPVAQSAPYTFYLPNAEKIEAVTTGDYVKVIMHAVPASETYDAERVWVKVTSASVEGIEGTLASNPYDMPLLEQGALIQLQRWHIIDIEFSDPTREQTFPICTRREYWDRGMVDQSVLDGDAKIDYIYRESPDLPSGENYSDSGWRVRGDTIGVSVSQLESRKAAYVALGAVLNVDDSWIHLLDEPVGSKFERNSHTGLFERLSD